MFELIVDKIRQMNVPDEAEGDKCEKMARAGGEDVSEALDKA